MVTALQFLLRIDWMIPQQFFFLYGFSQDQQQYPAGILGELARGRSLAVAFCFSDLWQVTPNMWPLICHMWHRILDTWFIQKYWCWWYNPHTSRDSVSNVCWIFLWLERCLYYQLFLKFSTDTLFIRLTNNFSYIFFLGGWKI